MRKHKAKICAIDGKQEEDHWRRHWDTYHPSEVPRELEEGTDPKKPWCQNWKDALDGAMPVNIRAEFKKSFKPNAFKKKVQRL